MTPKQKIKVSKFIALVLRHKPEEIDIKLDDHGWVSTNDLLAGLKQRFADMSLSVLKEIVAEDTKGRYSFNQTGHKIRANQGHSLEIDLGLAPVDPPEFLYHGTAKKTEWLIRRDGILPMSRQYVHLSNDRETAVTVGKRHGEPVVIVVQSGKMAENGVPFFRSDNGVWLTERVSVDYLAFEDSGYD